MDNNNQREIAEIVEASLKDFREVWNTANS